MNDINMIDSIIEESITETPIEAPSDKIVDGVVETIPIQLEEFAQDVQEPEFTDEDYQNLYGVVMETAHAVFSKSKHHRGLPETRRQQQGKLLKGICEKYGVTIPKEFEAVIFAGGVVADFQYMSRKEE